MQIGEKTRRCTLQDIAERTGFTINTVSRALKDKDDISAATKEHIKSVADEMGYVRNRAASSLRSGRTKTIGVIVGGMSNPYYGIMTDAIQNAAAALGYSILIFCSHDNIEIERRAVETALSYQVDGILLFPCFQSERTIARLKAVGIPYVLMSRHLNHEEDDYVVTDDEAGGYLAARHLLEAGHTRLGYLSTFNVVYCSERRIRGFYRALDEAGISRENGLIACCEGNTNLHQQLDAWRRDGVTGILSFCDAEAWNAVSYLQALGLAIPQDMSIASFDNIQSILPIPVPLCSIGYSFTDIAQSGISLIRNRIHNPDLAPQHVVYPPLLVCRGSCCTKDLPQQNITIPDLYSQSR